MKKNEGSGEGPRSDGDFLRHIGLVKPPPPPEPAKQTAPREGGEFTQMLAKYLGPGASKDIAQAKKAGDAPAVAPKADGPVRPRRVFRGVREAATAPRDPQEFRRLLGHYLGSETIDAVSKNKEAVPGPVSKPNPFRKNDIPVEVTLDLHGLNASQALSQLEYTLETMVKMKKTTLRVITGKGIHSPGAAVLRDEVIHALSHHSLVKRFQDAPARQGGSGAQMVEVKSEA